ncbi:hypothetical protein [Sorangium sp. So ce1078]|uniref:hypothetical protein n=1 Tax=Sorangium sp. So ce1078 TaxID=3133329 RepID=UPI003F5FDA34
MWVEHCASCPSAPPEDGTDCTDHDAETSCSYELDCGTTTATCDGPTGLWQVDQLDCGAGGQGGGGSQGGEGGEGGGGGEEDDGGGCG